MEWEDAPDVDKAWRLSIAKEKSDTTRNKYENKRMVMDLVYDIARMIEPTLVVGSVMDTLIEASSQCDL